MYDIAIIGGGIVGIATAYQLKQKNPNLKIAILEKEAAICNHQTGNNSGVIHSGVYYKPGSLKATNCINGYKMLIDFADKNDVPYKLCGKVIVATQTDEIKRLHDLYERGLQNGLNEIKLISAAQLKEIEPHVNGLEAIHVPYTGIIDYTQVAQKMLDIFKSTGGEIYLDSKIVSINHKNSYSELVTYKAAVHQAKLIINCAGLYSDKMATLTTKEKLDLRIIPFRGEYYLLKPEKRYLVKSLIYPVPDPNFPFLGVHFTNMINGDVECGPNAVFAFKREGYNRLDFNLKEFWESVSWPGFQKVAVKYWKTGLGEYYRSFSKKAFTKALQNLVPEVRENDLVPTHAGVRAQACERNGGLLDDFSIIETSQAINVCNAPSPAATSSLSIGNTVADLALKRV